MKVSTVLLTGAFLLLNSSPAARAANSIGVNFGTTYTLAATDSAGVAPYAQTNYNNVGTSPLTGLVLSDNTGTPTSGTLSITANMAYGVVLSNPVGPDETLNDTFEFTDAFEQTGPTVFTLSNIPYASYNLIVYDLQYNTGAVTGITAGNTTYYTSSPTATAAGYLDRNSATPFTYTRGTSTTSSAPTANADYVMFTGLSNSSFTVMASSLPASNLALIGGFQIVQVPEPSTWALLAGGLGTLVLLQRRRQRIA